MINPLRIFSKFGVLCLLLTINSHAAESYQLEIGAGIVAGQLPTYPGSPDNHQFLLPFPYIYYQDDSLTIDRQVINDKLFSIHNVTLSISAAGSIPVDSKNSRLRKDMPDIGWIGELGPALTYKLNKSSKLAWQIHKASSWQHGKYVNAGWRSNLAFTWRKEVDSLVNIGDLTINSEVSFHFADSKYHHIFYGIDPQYVTAERQKHIAVNGLTNIQFSLGATWRYNNLWLGMYAKHISLTGAANSDSPLLTEERQTSIGLAIAWIFIDK
ncbi:MipA/OmpV family protein [Alteromonadaceae bacterium BrNp21-10]|nr:MipA/OmpV family protein [Alteromonadaceae bacterium BrNp21-10]